ncbi:helix-turn-helix transcriptional regulator [Kitasatospora purpeofusca]|nr:helix-turn-helix transcriptional regulator [Kitasatospora purpeofusca]MDY0816080.1 helix-turn-helix transcriptional regulator [Kitasatospora purpeofusca]
MPRNHQVPRSFIAEGEWPDVKLTADAPPEAVVGYAFVLKVRAAMDARSWSARYTAEKAGVKHTTLNDLLAGRALPGLSTIVGLEIALQLDLYPAGLWAEIAESGDQARGGRADLAG